jgi:hypothetical protein
MDDSHSQRSFNAIETMPHRLGHRDAAAGQADTIDHFPGALLEAEKAAQRAHLDGLDAEQAQAASGTVNLLHRYGGSGKDNVVLVPAPTADPQGKLTRQLAIVIEKYQLTQSFYPI